MTSYEVSSVVPLPNRYTSWLRHSRCSLEERPGFDDDVARRRILGGDVVDIIGGISSTRDVTAVVPGELPERRTVSAMRTYSTVMAHIGTTNSSRVEAWII